MGIRLIPITREKIWELLNPKEAREVDRANALDAARERERSDQAKHAADIAHPDKRTAEPPD